LPYPSGEFSHISVSWNIVKGNSLIVERPVSYELYEILPYNAIIKHHYKNANSGYINYQSILIFSNFAENEILIIYEF